jgi:hypothetical protein
MNEMMNLLAVLLVLWIALMGFSMVIQRLDWAAALFTWPFRTSLRLTRWAIGSMFMALGRAIRGGGGHQNERRRH